MPFSGEPCLFLGVYEFFQPSPQKVERFSIISRLFSNNITAVWATCNKIRSNSPRGGHPRTLSKPARPEDGSPNPCEVEGVSNVFKSFRKLTHLGCEEVYNAAKAINKYIHMYIYICTYIYICMYIYIYKI